MNWEVFSIIGYVSVGFWLLVPLLWLAHHFKRPRRWLAHAALVVALLAAVMARVNSSAHVGRIQADMSEQIKQQMDAQALARQAAEKERAGEVADIRFAEDASGDFFDTAGLDDDDRDYFESYLDEATPEWKKQKKERSADGEADDLEALIGASEEEEGVEVAAELEAEDDFDPILMSDADKTMADRLDKANLTASEWVLGLAVVFVVFDYVRRLNVYDEAYCPLPVPSGWADAVTPRQAVATLPREPRRPLLGQLQHISRRGEVFVLFTIDPDLASKACEPMPRLPGGLLPVSVLDVRDDEKFDDGFVFETLWFGRHSFVVAEPDRAAAMLDRFLTLLTERRRSRARTRRTVYFVWDLAHRIDPDTRQRFADLAAATGWTLLFTNSTALQEADA